MSRSPEDMPDEVLAGLPEVQPELTEEAHGGFRDRIRHVVGVAGRTALKTAMAGSGMALALHLPYHTEAEGVPFSVQGSLVHRPGFSADTTLGNWEFPHVDGLPIGVHVTPEDVDALSIMRDASPDTKEYADKLQKDIQGQLPEIGLVLGAEVALGALGGLSVEMLGEWAAAHLRNRPRREHELRRFGTQLGAATLVATTVAGYGAATYNSRWMKDSRLTGTLAAAQAFPSQLSKFYNQQGKEYDVSQAILGIQESLQGKIDRQNAPKTSLNIMYISDVHLAPTYPLIKKYAEAFNVDLIINTGDEAEFGTTQEMTPEYINSIEELTKIAPMVWAAGNHDSPTTVKIMKSIPGVYVLGTKKSEYKDGKTTVAVSAGEIKAYGLEIGAVPDPRVYEGPGVYGAESSKVTDPLERSAVDSSLKDVAASGKEYDIMMSHEPVTVPELNKILPGIRETASGHLHAQNSNEALQPKSQINLTEGSSGQGGLDNLNDEGKSNTPFELSIESVAANCDFTKIIRIQQTTNGTPSPTDIPTFGDNTVMNTYYFKPQKIDADRTCAVGQGIGTVQEIVPNADKQPTVEAAGKGHH